MKLKNPDNEKYIKASLAGFCAIAAGLVLFFFLFRFRGVQGGFDRIVQILKPFIYGAVFAYILAPFCNRYQKGLLKAFGGKHEKLASGLSIVLAVVIALQIIAVLFSLVLPQLLDSIETLSNTMPARIDAAGKKIEALLAAHPELQEAWDKYGVVLQEKLEKWVHTDMLDLAQKILGNAAVYVQHTAVALKNIVLGVLISVYILISRRKFGAQAKMLLHGIFPNRAARIIEKEVHYADRMFNGFLVGKIIDSAIIGVLCFLGCLILHLESPALLAVIIGVTNIIPFFGPFIGAIPCVLMLLIQNPMHALIFAVFVFALQQLDGNIIGPRILGDTTGLSSFWVLFAILLFGGLWGVAGMIVGVPLFAVIYDIIRQLVSIGLGKHGRSGLEAAYREEFHPEDKTSAETETEA
ncbi:MAG: AI-2E family transporter [Firmicutes bacterium]|nr:AI-2E family transporter [Bacillota bacterium]